MFFIFKKKDSNCEADQRAASITSTIPNNKAASADAQKTFDKVKVVCATQKLTENTTEEAANEIIARKTTGQPTEASLSTPISGIKSTEASLTTPTFVGQTTEASFTTVSRLSLTDLFPLKKRKIHIIEQKYLFLKDIQTDITASDMNYLFQYYKDSIEERNQMMKKISTLVSITTTSKAMIKKHFLTPD